MRPKLFEKLEVLRPKPSKVGRPGDDVISKLVVKYTHKETRKPYYGCKGNGCNWLRSGNAQQTRILAHAPSCRYLSKGLKTFANDCAASSSLGAKLEAVAADSAPAAESDSQPPLKKQKTLQKQASLELDFTNAGRKELQAKLDHCIVKLICVNGLVPHILDSPEWKEFMAVANPRYKITPSDTFEEKYIPDEAAHVRKKVMGILAGEKNLTLTFDGNSTRKPQSVYTVHVTTKDRSSYFVDGYEGSDEHHTATWVKDKIVKASHLQIMSIHS
jgi:hypothetical protein